jgi:inhibitor of KinA
VTSASGALLRVAAAGDSALIAEFPQRIDPEINERAAALASRLRRQWGAVLRDVVVGYCTVTAYFDPLYVDARWLESEVRAAAEEDGDAPPGPPRTVEIPVCYDADLGPDLEDVAAFGSCSVEDVIARHTGRTYRVYMVGFVPGFAYLAQVDPQIAAPRRVTPRTLVPPLSVAIAGGQTGIYPRATPGGWNLIGRTAAVPYDPDRPDPSLLRVGDEVRFVRVSREDFERGA